LQTLHRVCFPACRAFFRNLICEELLRYLRSYRYHLDGHFWTCSVLNLNFAVQIACLLIITVLLDVRIFVTSKFVWAKSYHGYQNGSIIQRLQRVRSKKITPTRGYLVPHSSKRWAFLPVLVPDIVSLFLSDTKMSKSCNSQTRTSDLKMTSLPLCQLSYRSSGIMLLGVKYTRILLLDQKLNRKMNMIARNPR